MKEKDINIRIAKIRELTEQNSINRWELMRYYGSGITVTLESCFHARPARHCVSLTIAARYHYIRNQLRHNLLYYGIEVFFDIEPFNSLNSGENSEVTLPPRLMTIMYGVAVGALRGMLAQRVEHTQLRDYPLPLVNISELVSRNIYGTPVPEHAIPLIYSRYN